MTLLSLLAVWIFLLGLVLGSFLNVCIYRLPREGMSLWTPRSRCPRCQTQLAWHENIPLFSFIIQRGRCRHCLTAISWQYPLVELLTGLMAVALFYHYHHTPSLFLAYLWLIMILISSSVIDAQYRIIPDSLTYSTLLLAPLAGLMAPELFGAQLAVWPTAKPWAGLVSSLFGVFFGGGLIYAVGVFGKLVFRKEAMGFGDVKFMAAVGGFLGWDGVLLAFALACLFGSVCGVIIMFFTKDRYTPFGPYLSLGIAAVIFFRPHLLALTSRYFAW